MRFLPKPAGTEAEACIQGFIDAQMNARHEGAHWETVRIDYGSFGRTSQLRRLLTQEQNGLCAYTGAAIDGRLAERRPSLQDPPRDDYWFKPHIEHLKPEEQCREELVQKRGVVGRDLGEDLAYANMVAAIEVGGTPGEWFGASFRGTKALPILPTMPECEQRFEYLESGRVVGLNDEADNTIGNLRLDHPTLEDWRRGAIRSFQAGVREMKDVELTEIAQMRWEEDGGSKEFAFVLAPLAQLALKKRQASP